MRPLLAAALAVLLLALTSAGPLLLLEKTEATTANPAFARDWREQGSVSWHGFDARLQLAPDAPLRPDTETLVVLAPALAFDAAEVARVRSFVQEGGVLVVAGERGAGRQLLDDLDVGLRITGTTLYTPVFDESPDRVVTSAAGRVPGLPPEVVVTRPVIVEGGAAILRAPEPSWADVNANGRPDLDEHVVPAVVAAEASFGLGRVIAIGSSSFATTADETVQRAFVSYASGEGARLLVLDEAHRAESDPFGLSHLLSGSLSPLVATGILMVMVAVGGAIVLQPRFRREHARQRRAPPRAARDLDEVLSELESG